MIRKILEGQLWKLQKILAYFYKFPYIFGHAYHYQMKFMHLSFTFFDMVSLSNEILCIFLFLFFMAINLLGLVELNIIDIEIDF